MPILTPGASTCNDFDQFSWTATCGAKGCTLHSNNYQQQPNQITDEWTEKTLVYPPSVKSPSMSRWDTTNSIYRSFLFHTDPKYNRSKLEANWDDATCEHAPSPLGETRCSCADSDDVKHIRARTSDPPTLQSDDKMPEIYWHAFEQTKSESGKSNPKKSNKKRNDCKSVRAPWRYKHVRSVELLGARFHHSPFSKQTPCNRLSSKKSQVGGIKDCGMKPSPSSSLKSSRLGLSGLNKRLPNEPIMTTNKVGTPEECSRSVSAKSKLSSTKTDGCSRPSPSTGSPDSSKRFRRVGTINSVSKSRIWNSAATKLSNDNLKICPTRVHSTNYTNLTSIQLHNSVANKINETNTLAKKTRTDRSQQCTINGPLRNKATQTPINMNSCEQEFYKLTPDELRTVAGDHSESSYLKYDHRTALGEKFETDAKLDNRLWKKNGPVDRDEREDCATPMSLHKAVDLNLPPPVITWKEENSQRSTESSGEQRITMQHLLAPASTVSRSKINTQCPIVNDSQKIEQILEVAGATKEECLFPTTKRAARSILRVEKSRSTYNRNRSAPARLTIRTDMNEHGPCHNTPQRTTILKNDKQITKRQSGFRRCPYKYNHGHTCYKCEQPSCTINHSSCCIAICHGCRRSPKFTSCNYNCPNTTCRAARHVARKKVYQQKSCHRTCASHTCANQQYDTSSLHGFQGDGSDSESETILQSLTELKTTHYNRESVPRCCHCTNCDKVHW